MFFFFNDTATTEIYTLSLHDALPIYTFFSFLLIYSLGLGFWGRGFQLMGFWACGMGPSGFIGVGALYINIGE